MTIDAIHAATASLNQTMERMEQNAQAIASATIQDRSNMNPNLPVTVQVAPSPQSFDASNWQSRYYSSPPVVHLMVDNIKLSHHALAQMETIKTANDMLGFGMRIGSHVSVRV